MLIGYARVSTQDQNPDLQVDALNKIGCKKIFTEKASGVQRDRPQLIAALDYMRESDTLVVWKLDRLARSTRQLIETVETLKSQNMELRSITEQIDTSTPSGELIFHVFAALAQFERSIIVERTQSGLAAARAKGRVGGRPNSLTEEQQQMAKSMLRDPEIPIKRIVETLDTSIATLYRYFPGGRSALQDGTAS